MRQMRSILSNTAQILSNVQGKDEQTRAKLIKAPGDMQSQKRAQSRAKHRKGAQSRSILGKVAQSRSKVCKVGRRRVKLVKGA